MYDDNQSEDNGCRQSSELEGGDYPGTDLALKGDMQLQHGDR